MTQRRQWVIVSAVVVLLAGAVVAGAGRFGAPDPVNVGFRAPEFQARDLADPTRVARLGDYAGNVVLLNVWATWCLPCREEMPSIERLHREFGSSGLKVVAVSVDDGGAEDDIRAFAREYGLTFEILHDPTGKILRDYQMIGVPETFVIDRDGVIRIKAFAADWYSEEHRAAVARLIAEGD